jgi:hypothetical protein
MSKTSKKLPVKSKIQNYQQDRKRKIPKQNPKIKFVAKLRDRSKRNGVGLLIVEAFRECLCAFENGVAFESLFLCATFFLRQ